MHCVSVAPNSDMHSQHINVSSSTTASTTFTYHETASSSDLNYNVTHVFLPVHLPNSNPFEALQKELLLAHMLCAVAYAYSVHVCRISEQAQWHCITKMLDNLQASVQC